MSEMKISRRCVLPMLAIALAACGDLAPEDYAQQGGNLPPVTHGATLTADTFPATLNPGERLNLCLTMQNSGASSPTDDWTLGQHYLRSRNTPFFEWSWPLSQLSASTAVGASNQFCFVGTAPTGASATFDAGMFYDGGFFGDTIAIGPMAISGGNTRRWDCSLVSSDLPATMEINENADREHHGSEHGNGHLDLGQHVPSLDGYARTFVGSESLCCPIEWRDNWKHLRFQFLHYGARYRQRYNCLQSPDVCQWSAVANGGHWLLRHGD